MTIQLQLPEAAVKAHFVRHHLKGCCTVYGVLRYAIQCTIIKTFKNEQACVTVPTLLWSSPACLHYSDTSGPFWLQTPSSFYVKP